MTTRTRVSQPEGARRMGWAGKRLAGPEGGKPTIPMRHELKYYITQGDYLVLRTVLKGLLRPDPYGDARNEYHIRSLYFDDQYDTALNDKLAGVKHRDKYRIRIYNVRDDQIKLECKTKYDQFISKVSASITPNLCEALCTGRVAGLEKAQHPLLRDAFRLITGSGLKPVVIVDYVREAYLHPIENVRITFDKQLRTGLWAHETHDLFNPELPTVSPLDEEMVILEVKYDDYLPEYVRHCLGSIQGTRSAISKYTLCRRYE